MFFIYELLYSIRIVVLYIVVLYCIVLLQIYYIVPIILSYKNYCIERLVILDDLLDYVRIITFYEVTLNENHYSHLFYMLQFLFKLSLYIICLLYLEFHHTFHFYVTYCTSSVC